MARQTTIEYVDDLDGSAADGPVEFAIDGKAYEIDLSEANAAKLRDSLAEFVAAGRKVGRATVGQKGKKVSDDRPVDKGTAAQERELNQTRRAWAASHGRVVSNRGRVPADVIEAYDAQDPNLLEIPAEEVAA